TQFAAPGRLGDRLTDGFLQRDLIDSDGRMDEESRHARVLADRAFIVGGHVDVGCDDAERLRRLRARRFGAKRASHCLPHIGRQIGRSLSDQLYKAVLKKFHRTEFYVSPIRTSAVSPGRTDGLGLMKSIISWPFISPLPVPASSSPA